MLNEYARRIIGKIRDVLEDEFNSMTKEDPESKAACVIAAIIFVIEEVLTA